MIDAHHAGPISPLSRRRGRTEIPVEPVERLADPFVRRHGVAISLVDDVPLVFGRCSEQAVHRELSRLDGLKRVNDTRGHEAGDALLRRAVGALQSSLRKYDQIARLGGDEFGILAPETGPVEGETLFHRVRTALAEAGIEASTGYAVRGHGTDMQHAWTAADSAMYDDKRRRRAGKG